MIEAVVRYLVLSFGWFGVGCATFWVVAKVRRAWDDRSLYIALGVLTAVWVAILFAVPDLAFVLPFRG